MKKKAELNLIDKAIAFFNPQGGVSRLVARQKLKNFEYDAVKYSRERKGPSSLSGAEDYRSNYDRVELMKRARDLAENVGLVRSLLLKFAGHVAGTISYQARTQNPQVNTEVEAYWNEWWDKCDISTRHTGSTLMQVAVMSMLRDGDFLFVLVRDANGDLKIQGIEADRLGDPVGCAPDEHPKHSHMKRDAFESKFVRKVKSIRFDTALDGMKPDILAVDIEGAEWMVIGQMRQSRPRLLRAETHFTHSGYRNPDYDRINEYLGGLGYQMIVQDVSDSLYFLP